MPDFLRKRGRKFHFRKRIPKHFLPFFDKDVIQVPLGTDSKIIAVQRALNFNQMFEDFLTGLSEETEVRNGFKDLVLRAKRNRFQEFH